MEAVGGGGEGAAGDGGGAKFAAELVDGLVELAGAVALFVGEEGELLGLAVGEVTEGDAEQAEGAAVPEFGEEGFGAVIELLRDVAGLGEAALVGAVFEVTAADGDGEAEAAAAVGAKAGGDAVAQGEQDLIGLRDGGDVLLEGGGVAVAFDGLGLGEDGGGVDAAGVVVQEGGGADAGELLQVGEVRPGRSPIVRMRAAVSFSARARPTESRSPTGSGQSFCGISAGKRVWTLSGFSKSLAILARSLFSEMPTLTVKPSSEKMASLIWWATARGSG